MQRSESVIGGFSQGAMLALALAFRAGATKPAGVLGMSGSLPPGDGIEYDWTNPPAVLLQHGTHDPLIPAVRARQTAESLASHGVPVVYREYEMEHSVSLESVRDAKEWLDKLRAGERPSEPLTPPPPTDDLVAHVSSTAFPAGVLQSRLPVVVDFWAPWCGPCRQVEPVIRQMAAMRKGRYKFVKVNIDEAPDLAQQYQVQSIPLVALFRDGRMERKSLGAKPRQQLEADLGMLVIP
jgi:thioredoxin 1